MFLAKYVIKERKIKSAIWAKKNNMVNDPVLMEIPELWGQKNHLTDAELDVVFQAPLEISEPYINLNSQSCMETIFDLFLDFRHDYLPYIEKFPSDWKMRGELFCRCIHDLSRMESFKRLPFITLEHFAVEPSFEDYLFFESRSDFVLFLPTDKRILEHMSKNGKKLHVKMFLKFRHTTLSEFALFCRNNEKYSFFLIDRNLWGKIIITNNNHKELLIIHNYLNSKLGRGMKMTWSLSKKCNPEDDFIRLLISVPVFGTFCKYLVRRISKYLIKESLYYGNITKYTSIPSILRAGILTYEDFCKLSHHMREHFIQITETISTTKSLNNYLKLFGDFLNEGDNATDFLTNKSTWQFGCFAPYAAETVRLFIENKKTTKPSIW
jgi:hypothetical protein